MKGFIFIKQGENKTLTDLSTKVKVEWGCICLLNIIRCLLM